MQNDPLPHLPVVQPLVDKETLARVYLGGITQKTVENYVRSGLIPYVKLGRRILFDPADVIAALKAQRKGA